MKRTSNLAAWIIALGLSPALMLAPTGCDKKADESGDKAETAKDQGKKAQEPAAKSAESAAANPAADAPAETAKAEAPADAAPKKSVAEIRREKVAAAMKAVYCAQRVDDGADILAIYKAQGFESPDAFQDAWSKDAKKKPEWAQETLAALSPAACKAGADPTATP